MKDRRTGKLHHDGSRVWIDNVPEPIYPELAYGWSIFAPGFQALLKFRGHDVSLEEIMAFTGDAFAFCYGQHWNLLAEMNTPTDPFANAAQAYGYDYELISTETYRGGVSNLEGEELRRVTAIALDRIRKEIDAENPVLVGGITDAGCSHWSIVVGYDTAQPLLCHLAVGHPYRWVGIRGIALRDLGTTDHWNARVRGIAWHAGGGGWADNPFFVLGNKRDQSSDKNVIITALQRASQLFHAQDLAWGSRTRWYFGKRGYEEWARALDVLDYPNDIQQRQNADEYQVAGCMGDIMHLLLQGRMAAASFCKEAARILPHSRSHLLAAAQLYADEVVIASEALVPFIDCIPAACEAWLSNVAQRKTGTKAIMQMLAKEEAIIANIEKALELTPEGDV